MNPRKKVPVEVKCGPWWSPGAPQQLSLGRRQESGKEWRRSSGEVQGEWRIWHFGSHVLCILVFLNVLGTILLSIFLLQRHHWILLYPPMKMAGMEESLPWQFWGVSVAVKFKSTPLLFSVSEGQGVWVGRDIVLTFQRRKVTYHQYRDSMVKWIGSPVCHFPVLEFQEN